MPEGSVIRAIVQSETIPGMYVMLVEHPDLPEVREGETVPETIPTLTADYEKRPATWLTWDWGLTTVSSGRAALPVANESA